jgi:hypothetical protein
MTVMSQMSQLWPPTGANVATLAPIYFLQRVGTDLRHLRVSKKAADHASRLQWRRC